MAKIAIFGPFQAFPYDLNHRYTFFVDTNSDYSISAFQNGLNHSPSLYTAACMDFFTIVAHRDGHKSRESKSQVKSLTDEQITSQITSQANHESLNHKSSHP